MFTNEGWVVFDRNGEFMANGNFYNGYIPQMQDCVHADPYVILDAVGKLFRLRKLARIKLRTQYRSIQ